MLCVEFITVCLLGFIARLITLERYYYKMYYRVISVNMQLSLLFLFAKGHLFNKILYQNIKLYVTEQYLVMFLLHNGIYYGIKFHLDQGIL